MKYSKEEYIGIGKVPIGIGAIINGWNVSEKHYRNPEFLSVVDFRAMTPACQWDCFHCFTDKLKKTLTLEKIKEIIDQLAEMKTQGIDYVGEGEPTLDKDFFDIIEYTQSQGIQSIIFTDGATKLRNREFVKRLYKSGASVCLKGDSLWNSEYQNFVVGDDKKIYFDQRNEAVKLLAEEGFNKKNEDGTTRMGFDMVVSRKNMDEVEKTLRYCRENNFWIVFAFYLPAGRSGMEEFDKELLLTREEKIKICNMIKEIDEKDYGFKHVLVNNFATIPCIEFIQIYGDGRVSPCPGNETIIGNLNSETLKELKEKIIKKFPVHDKKTFDGNCPYREKVN
ncbi:radical SAM protein [archaeon]|jgi:MoaA/NifB/PqqE/SkfB family radical SAM enzyme|nr:radical SAM protein [archaeon]MBT4396695.1 radical SAM protein [archaeon]MBT4441305.1 radical SAM protein [archaeon]